MAAVTSPLSPDPATSTLILLDTDHSEVSAHVATTRNELLLASPPERLRRYAPHHQCH